jgi:pilus assembly protein Flp/PilA
LNFPGERLIQAASLGRGFEMKKFADSVKKFIVSEDGPTAVEYAVMMALIIVVCIGTVTTIGTNAKSKFEAVKTALS